ncbi:uncharacterized protein LOC143221804 [Lasioglossum baleicum]|uniref:uncharacterized protein LOC143221804 n=1 Tax=Lasioglossum baleicum TaxID=434251 RepID=UPI003FCCF1BA
MQNKRNVNKPIKQQLLPRMSRNRRLCRPADLQAAQVMSILSDNNAQLVNDTIMIPIPPEDAKALGLRIPESGNSSIRSNSSSSRNASLSSGAKIAGERSNDSSRSNKILRNPRNVEVVKPTKKLQGLKENESSEREQATKKLSSFQARLKKGLKKISYKKGHQIDDLEATPECSQKSDLPSVLKGSNRSSIGSGKLKKNLSNCQEDKADKVKKESGSMSMRQLFNIADSWSTDSIFSHSDSCPCCHNREIRRPRATDFAADT